MLVDEHLANLVGGIGVFAIICVIILKQKILVAVFDDGFGMRLDFVHHAQDFGDLGVECAGFAVENVAVGVGTGVAIIYEFSVTANLAVVAGDERLSVMDKLISNNYFNRIPKLLFTWGK